MSPISLHMFVVLQRMPGNKDIAFLLKFLQLDLKNGKRLLRVMMEKILRNSREFMQMAQTSG